MAQYGYSIQDMENRARACARDMPMSYKVAVMIGRRIKGMPAEKALRFLKDVQDQKQAVPYTKFNDSVGHRPGMGPGRYPLKAAKIFEMVLKNAVSNAEDLGLGKEVVVEFVVTQRASEPFRNRTAGRHSAKRSHLEIVVGNKPQETPAPAKKAAKKTPVAKKAAVVEQ